MAAFALLARLLLGWPLEPVLVVPELLGRPHRLVKKAGLHRLRRQSTTESCLQKKNIHLLRRDLEFDSHLSPEPGIQLSRTG